MTHCSAKKIDFRKLGRRRIEADFNGGRLTSDAGALLLRAVNQETGLIEALNDSLIDPREPAKIQHQQRELLAQRIIALALGYEDLNDHQTLRFDPALQVAAERSEPTPDCPLASPSTLCRFENRITRAACVRMSGVFVEQFIASFKQTPSEELILDFDATDDVLHGEQEGRFFHGYYRHYCYLPLDVFCGDELLCAYLRPSNIDAAKHARAILKLLVDKLRAVWPGVKIIFRADSGFCRWRLLRWCDRHQVHYVLGLARNKVLERRSKAFAEKAEAEYQRTGVKQRHFHEIQYGARSWDRKRRVIIKAEHLPKGRNLRYLVTNLDDATAQSVYDQLYCHRGERENRIKEQQLGLFADRTSCSKMLANQFRLLLSSAASVLMQALRRTALADTELAHAQIETIRLKLLKIAARVIISTRRVVFHLATSYPYQELLRTIIHRITSGAAESGRANVIPAPRPP